MDGMETDLIWISAAAGFHKPLVVITGDANLQPISLGGGADISLARDVRWVAFMSRWPLILQNPSLLGQMRLPVLLPARGRNVHIRPSDTHHGGGLSRAIDLVVTGADVSADVVVHNGVHCNQYGLCPWDGCVDFTLGDHFLLSVSLPGLGVCHDIRAAPQLPHRWCNQQMWQQGFVAANPVLECFGAFLAQATRDIEGSSPDARVAHGQWLADAAAFVLSVITGCVRDGWVLLSMRMGSRAPKRARTAGLARDADPVSVALGGDHALSTWPADSIRACFHWLRRPQPRPPLCLREDGVVLTEEQSHTSWEIQIASQGIWLEDWDQTHHAKTYVLTEFSWALRAAMLGQAPSIHLLQRTRSS